MAYLSTLGSPGIEVFEYDDSLRVSTSSGTTVFVPGYASQGPVEEINVVTSISDFEDIYGTPTNAAERYFYYTVLALLNNSGSGTTILTSRLPYGEGTGDTTTTAFSMLAYPAVPVASKTVKSTTTLNDGSSTTFENTYNYPVYEFTEILKANNFFDNLKIKTGAYDDNGNLIYDKGNVHLGYETGFTQVTKAMVILSASYQSKSILSIEAEGDYIDSTDDSKDINENILKITIEDCTDSYFVDLDVTNSYDETTGYITSSFYGIIKDDLDAENTDAEKLGIVMIDIVWNGSPANLDFIKFFFPGGVTGVSSFLSIPSGDTDVTYTEVEVSCSVPYGTVDSSGNLIPFSKDSGISNLNYSGEYKNIDNVWCSAFDDGTIDNISYYLGSPMTYQISLSEYYQLLNGELMTWSKQGYSTTTLGGDDLASDRFVEMLSRSAFIMINTSRTIINENFEGYYFGLTDNIFNEPQDNRTYNAISGVKITTKTSAQDEEYNVGLWGSDFSSMSSDRLDFYTASNNTGSLSRVVQCDCTSYDTSATGYDDTLSLALLKLTKATTAEQALTLSYSNVENYNVSLGKSRLQGDTSTLTPVTYFAENLLLDSSNLSILVNPYISANIKIDIEGNLTGKVRIASNKIYTNLASNESTYLTNQMSVNNSSSNAILTKLSLAQNCLSNYDSIYAQAGIDYGSYKVLFGDGVTDAGVTEENFNQLNEIYPLGVYTVETTTNKIIGDVPTKVSNVLTLIENDEEYPDIDIILEAGLGTVYCYSHNPQLIADSTTSSLLEDESNDGGLSSEESSTSSTFDETLILQGVEDLRCSRTSLTSDAENVILDFLDVQNSFMQLANSYVNGGRNDTFYIADTLRGILIKGKDTKVQTLFGTELTNNAYYDGTEVNHSWSTSIYYPHYNLFNSFVSSYASVYAQWLKISDEYCGEYVWVPSSGYVAALMCSTDALYGPWYAAAGLNRGIISGVLDCAVNPTATQRTTLYKICINSIPKISNVGITVWGIRTMSKTSTAMDQNTCRRTFLQMIKTVKQYLKYYIFEPNTAYTRLRCYNDLDPYLSDLMARDAIYSYTLTCDTTNNTADVINNGEMAVDISAAPTRTAENIVLSMTANKYSADVSTSTFNSD